MSLNYKYVIADWVTVRKFTTLALSELHGRISIKSGEPMRIVERSSTESGINIYGCSFPYEDEGFKANKIFRFKEQDLIPWTEPIG